MSADIFRWATPGTHRVPEHGPPNLGAKKYLSPLGAHAGCVRPTANPTQSAQRFQLIHKGIGVQRCR